MTAPVAQPKAPAQTSLRPLIIIGLLLASFGLVALGLRPDLDLNLSRHFFEAPGHFTGAGFAAHAFRRFAMILPFIAYIAAIFASFWCFHAVSGKAVSRPWHNVFFLTVTFALGPGLLVNSVFKTHVHRPRPVHVQEFGGAAAFQPFYRMDGACRQNCSFPSGETAAAFWTMAPAALLPAPIRAAVVGAAIVFGALTGLLRLAAGAHFLSDVLFSGWLMGVIIVAAWLLLRPKGWRGSSP